MEAAGMKGTIEFRIFRGGISLWRSAWMRQL